MLLIVPSRPFCRICTTRPLLPFALLVVPANLFPSYTTYVINDAETTYANAYFEINYINVYSNSTTSAANSTSGSGASATKTNTIGASGTGSASASTSRSAGRSFKRWEGAGTGMGWVYIAGMAVLGGLVMVL
jgi:hypothetical protein